MFLRSSCLVAGLFLAGCAAKTGSPPVVQDSEEVRYFLEHKERWAVKTGADADAGKIPLSDATPTTVEHLRSLEPPGFIPKHGGDADRRFDPVETTLYSLDVDLVRYKLETDDQDFHVVVRDHDGSSVTMIVEFVDPTFVSHASPFRSMITAARAKFDSIYHPRTSWGRKRGHLRITGVGFFDFKHGQSGVAPNAIELHPVLSCEILE
ncbi:hypothetical protein [Fimbriimonas ginsengisoli]|uniref:Lipoprotein n=1 Tax=Fimbriimonas ginsengisoli Gsoil 348 TaxID=661478 RepID=A0A068NUE1_FIMGI|nr:hypothetical protein [Fimbriimonas ginsengisoli]AIE85234.1 hypothetical protein OP10G_1866 [Fimbriimonas ginsengisoli Gsoil 348]